MKDNCKALDEQMSSRASAKHPCHAHTQKNHIRSLAYIAGCILDLLFL